MRSYTFIQARERAVKQSNLFYSWIVDRLHLLPMGVSNLSEKYLAQMIEEHPGWVSLLINFLWSVDITDIRDIRVKDDKVIFVHTNVTQHYASYFSWKA